MKRWVGVRWAMAAFLLCAVAAFAGNSSGDKKEKQKGSSTQTVDSGSFGVFVKGQRVVTESFHIQQENGNSSIKAQLKEASGSAAIDQKSSLEITGNGGLVRYEWSEGGPAGGTLTVLPNNEFLIEKISTATMSKPAEEPFLMPNTSVILDNNFFVQREILVWRYLATALCQGESGNRKCQPQDYGVLVPQDRTSTRVRMELIGKEKVTIRGAERELIRLNLSGEGFEWGLWVDEHDHFKLIRIGIPADSTEVVRD